MNKILTLLQQPRLLALSVALASAAALASAYISQYGFGLKPCILCLYQRVPYFVNIGLGLAAFAVSFRYPRLARRLILLAVLAFIADAVIAGFHVGVEQKWWKGLPECGGDLVPKNATIEQLRAALSHQNIVRCDEPAWVFLGISMAGYNFLLSLALASGTLYFARKGSRHGA